MRCREPDVWQHVTIRGIARRSIFDGDADARTFSNRITRLVERGDLGILAFCLMPNHAHLILRSPEGRLGDAMRDLEGPYVRRFNPPRDRSGHLVEGRYWARPIRTQRYMTAAIAYIDQNPVDAGLVRRPQDYPHGSARCYASAAGPSWLDRTWVEAYLREGREEVPYSPALYARVFGTRTAASARRWFSAVLSGAAEDDPTLDQLIAASPEYILRWMEERVRTSDGTGRVLPLADAETISSCVASVPPDVRSRRMGSGGRSRPLGRVLECGLLRHLGGLPHLEIAARVGQSPGTARLSTLAHGRALLHDAGYRELVGRLARQILDACHPAPSDAS